MYLFGLKCKITWTVYTQVHRSAQSFKIGVWWSNGHLFGPRNTCQSEKPPAWKPQWELWAILWCCLNISRQWWSYRQSKRHPDVQNPTVHWCLIVLWYYVIMVSICCYVAITQIYWYWYCLHIPDGLSMVIPKINGGRRSQLYWWSALSYPSSHWNHFACQICKGVSFFCVCQNVVPKKRMKWPATSK